MTNEQWWEKYRRHLESPEWAEKRRQVRERSGGRCEISGCKRKARHCHHLTYARLGRERLEDLIDLCDLHHQQEHPHRKLYTHPVRRVLRQMQKRRRKFGR